jgi:ribulose-phosphate 3-epimerase
MIGTTPEHGRTSHQNGRAGVERLRSRGGVDPETAPQAVAAGANVLVAGTAAFRGGPKEYAANIRALKGAG